MNIHGTAGVRCVWAGAGLQRVAYRGGGISCSLVHSLLNLLLLYYFWFLVTNWRMSPLHFQQYWIKGNMHNSTSIDHKFIKLVESDMVLAY